MASSMVLIKSVIGDPWTPQGPLKVKKIEKNIFFSFDAEFQGEFSGVLKNYPGWPLNPPGAILCPQR